MAEHVTADGARRVQVEIIGSGAMDVEKAKELIYGWACSHEQECCVANESDAVYNDVDEVLALIDRTVHELERLRGERFDTSDVKTRDLGHIAVEGLTVMKDDDDDSWELPDLATINRAITAVGALVQHAEDRQRFKRALTRIGKEWTDRSGSADDVRQFARDVIAGGSARVPFVRSKDGA